MNMEQNKRQIIREILKLWPFYLFFIFLTFYVSGNIFFWDTIQLGSKHAYFFYENHFLQILLPDYIDSGHIPTFGAYLAFCWIIFGKTLVVSHFAMLPFLLGIVWQSYVLLRKYISQKYIYLALILFLSDATLLSQATLMTPDIPLVFLFLLGLNSVLANKKILITIASAGLILISMRGMMVAFALLIIDIILNVKFSELKSVISQLLKKGLIYLPALLIFVCYSAYHYKVKGWIGYHKDSPWASLFVRVSFKGDIYNIGILCWRLLDFGRVFLWIVALVLVLKYYKKLIKDKKTRQLLMIFLLVIISLSMSFVIYKNLSGHRYLLPAYLMFSLFTIYLVFEKLGKERWKYAVFAILLAGMLSGNLWVYPKKIRMGWDSTLGHLPYYSLRNQMQNYLEKEKLSITEVGSDFPDMGAQKYLDLNDNNQIEPKKNLDNDRYVLYSNVFNDFQNIEIDRLRVDFILVKEFKQGAVFFRLYKKIESK